MLRKWFFGNEKNLMRKSAIWNLISSVEYSLQSAVLMLIVTRVAGLYDAGVFTLAYTLTQMMATIGSYGMRNFQVSDIKKEYSFSTYLSSRIVSVVAMIVICISYAVIQGYDGEKLCIIALLCGYRVVDDLEDVFHGEMQKEMRLDVASKIVAVRIFLATVAFATAYILTKNLIVSSAVLTITSAIVSLIINAIVSGDFKDISLEIGKKDIIKLLWVCLPICAGGFLYNYLVNAPKYAIDRNLSEATQTIFSILFMPIFAINMLSSFIFKPMIVTMGVQWNKGENSKFLKSVIRQIVIILGITILAMLAGAVAGIDILGWMYNVNLEKYRFLFTILIAFGGVAALVAFLVVLLTIIRQQKYIIFAYGVGTAIDLLFIDRVVRKYEIWGAGMMYGIAMGIVVIILLMVLIVAMYKRKGVKSDKIFEKSIS